MSERLVGSIVAFHGDDKGLVLPPDVAPFQIVIIPILAKGKVEEVMAEARKLRDELLAAGLRVTLDERDDRPGSKFYHWEIKGVPLRLELGGRDIAEGKVSYAIRHDGSKGTFLRGNAIKDSQAMLAKISIDMMSNAAKRLASSVETITSLDVLPKKILRFGWCGSEECGHKIEEKTELKLLGTPYVPENFHGECIMCGKQTGIAAYAARSM